MLPNLQDSRILLTGGTGFIGRALSLRLLELGSHLMIMGRSRPEFVPEKWQARLQFLPADFLTPSTLVQHREILQMVDTVIHAGGTILKTSLSADEDLLTVVEANVTGTARLLALLPPRLAGICFTSTLDVYGMPHSLPVHEDHATAPQTYYGAAKLACEHLLRIYSNRTRVPVSILRLSHTYGPGDTSQKVIPNCVRAVLLNQSPMLYGDGTDIRDYVFVSDVVEAIVQAATLKPAGVFNIGAGRGHAISEIVEQIIRLAGRSVVPERKPRRTPAMNLVLNVERARAQLQYHPRVTIEEGLARTIRDSL